MENACLLQYVAKAACSRSIICVCVPSREGEQGEGCRCRCTERAKDESVNKGRGGGGYKMRGMHDRKQTKTLGGREEEGDTARRKRDREGEREKYGKEEDKSSLCCGDFHAHFRMQLVRGHLPTVSDVCTVRCHSVVFHVLYPSPHLERTLC